LNVGSIEWLKIHAEVKVFHRGNECFFDELVSLVAALSSFEIAIEVHTNNGVSINAMKKDHSLTLYGRTSSYSWNPHNTMESLKNDAWPDTLTLAKLPPYEPLESGLIELRETGTSSFIHSTCDIKGSASLI